MAQRVHWDSRVPRPSATRWPRLRVLRDSTCRTSSPTGWRRRLARQPDQRIRNFNYVGDTHVDHGEVVGKRVEDGLHLVDIEIGHETSATWSTCPGTPPSRCRAATACRGAAEPPGAMARQAAVPLERHGAIVRERRAAGQTARRSAVTARGRRCRPRRLVPAGSGVRSLGPISALGSFGGAGERAVHPSIWLVASWANIHPARPGDGLGSFRFALMRPSRSAGRRAIALARSSVSSRSRSAGNTPCTMLRRRASSAATLLVQQVSSRVRRCRRSRSRRWCRRSRRIARWARTRPRARRRRAKRRSQAPARLNPAPTAGRPPWRWWLRHEVEQMPAWWS